MSSSTTTAAASTTPANEDAGSQKAREDSGHIKHDIDRMQISMYQGWMMAYYDEPVEVHVPKVMNLALRDTDIVLLTYPKSGTHWVWRVLDMLVTGSATYSNRFVGTCLLDLVPVEFIDGVSKDRRRILNTHYPSDLLPTQVKDGHVKVVHVYRHPKAVMVSLMFHLRSGKKFSELTLNELDAMMYSDNARCKNQFHYLDQVKEYERDNPDVDIFHLAYEDMKKDILGCVKKLAVYLNVDASDELCTSIAEAVSFNTQKIHEEAGCEAQKTMRIYREGEADGWKNHLTVAQSERMDKLISDRAASCQFCRRYCPTITTDQGDVYRLSSSS